MTMQLIFAVLLLLLAGVLFVASAGNMYHLTNSDAAGNGLAQAFTAFAIVGLWVLVLILMIWVSSTSLTPAWLNRVTLFLIIPGAGAASLAVMSLLSDREPVHWMIPGPAIIAPAIYLAVAVWTLVLRRPLATSPLLVGVMVMIALSLLAPWPAIIRRPEVRRQRNAAYEAARAEATARFERLRPDSPVREWAQLTTLRNLSDEQRQQAFQAIRAHPRKAEEIAQMLREGDATLLPSLWDLELDADTATVICQPAREMLLRKANDLRPRPDRNRFALVATEADSLTSTVDWLARQSQCRPVDDVIAAFRSMAESYPDHRDEAALFLAHLRRAGLD